MASWNGVCFWVYPGLSPPIDLKMSSDASGSLEFGAVFRTHWLYGKWPSALQSTSIEYKELFPIVVAAHVWGSSWFRQVVLFHCDNESVVFILNSQLPTIISYFQPSTLPVLLTKSLMLYLVFIGRPFANWRHMPTVILQ